MNLTSQIDGFNPPVQEKAILLVNNATQAFRSLIQNGADYERLSNSRIAKEAGMPHQQSLYQWFSEGKKTLAMILAMQEYEDAGDHISKVLSQHGHDAPLSADKFVDVYLTTLHKWFTDAPQPSILLDDEFKPTFEEMHRTAYVSWIDTLSEYFAQTYPQIGIKRQLVAIVFINTVCSAIKTCYSPKHHNKRYVPYLDMEILAEYKTVLVRGLEPEFEIPTEVGSNP